MAEQVQVPDWYRSDRLIYRQNLEVRLLALVACQEAVRERNLIRMIQARALFQSYFHAEAIRLNNLYHQMVLHGVDRIPGEWANEQ